MPAISSGIFGFPKDRYAKVLVKECKKFLESNDDDNNNNGSNNTHPTLDIVEILYI